MLIESIKIGVEEIESDTGKDSCIWEVKIIVDSTKMGEGIKEEGGKGGRVEGSESGMVVEDYGGHSTKALAKLTSLVILFSSIGKGGRERD